MSETIPEPVEPEPSVPEPTPEPEPAEPEAAWAGPSQEEWEATQAQLAQAAELVSMFQTASYTEPEQPEQYQLPEYDPFDPDSAQAYFEARDERLLSRFEQMLNPVLERESNAQADAWATQTFERLGVPENDLWRDGVLFASAGFQQFDPYGRPLVHPQQAAAQGYEFLKRFSESERAAERELLKQQNEKQDEALRNRASSPQVPSGPGGGEGVPEGMDELQAARIWRERNASSF